MFVSYYRDNEAPVQIASAPAYPPQSGMQPIIHHGFQSTLSETMSMPHVTDQFGSLRPSWYDPYSER